ncbi:MAG: hypothetical protein WBQ25_03640 [Nitrososphaeraceae archaeon]
MDNKNPTDAQGHAGNLADLDRLFEKIKKKFRIDILFSPHLLWQPQSAMILFVYAIRSPVTREYYLCRLRRFFDFLQLKEECTLEERCNYFAKLGKNDC